MALAGVLVNDGRALYEAFAAARTAGAGYAEGSHAARADGTTASEALRSLAAAHLFGVRPVASLSAANEARDTSLVLTGIIATGDPAVGYALIGTSKSQAHVHAVGGTIAQGVVLRAIYRDHVVVERDGRLASVRLPRATAPPLLPPPLQQPAESVAGAAPDDSPDSPQRQIEDALQKENERTAAVLEERAYVPQGEFRGVLIEPGTNPELLAQLGLKPGDVLRAVDSTTVESDRLDMLRQRLASGRPVEVSVTRPGVGPMELTVDSNLVAGMIEN